MATAGLYDDSGKWLYATGLPAKSGVGGGIIAVSPGKFGIAVISPPLDKAGNSVKAQKAIADISNALGGNPYAPKPSSPFSLQRRGGILPVSGTGVSPCAPGYVKLIAATTAAVLLSSHAPLFAQAPRPRLRPVRLARAGGSTEAVERPARLARRADRALSRSAARTDARGLDVPAGDHPAPAVARKNKN
jgi:hypothetical protein